EITKPGEPLPLGKIYDINTYTLITAILESGGKPLDFGIVGDHDEKLLTKTLKEAIGAANIVITSGGVSVGPKDVMPKLIDGLGSPGLVVHGVAVKPGKPLAVAVIGKTPIFSLPGHPTSSLLMFHLLVRPMLLRIVGREEGLATPVEAITSERLFSAPGRRTFIMVTLSRDDEGRWLARRVHTGESGAITTMAKADGYVELGEDDQFIEAGERVSVSAF
ncbi:MAG: molybdopterin molybdotransferase MoeA, partial [Candidatus Bathyarchaeota archaeon]|nr:molybdopterin molybdotransferase MoeA [Candidatus Bathyarchaeota archaeon]